MTALAPPVLLGGEIFRHSSYGPWHPLRIPRVTVCTDLARALGWAPPGVLRTAPRAKPRALHLFHAPRYVAALVAAEAAQEVTEEVRAAHGLGTTMNPVFPEMYRRPATGAGGCLLAADLLTSPGGPRAVHNPAGGTHHGMPDRAAGFCYLNDPALAILMLRRLGAGRVAYVDLDAHHPDGVALVAERDPEVLLISHHQEGLWPRTGALEEAGMGNQFNLPLPPGAGDADMALALDEVILPRLADFGPAVVVLQCGADSLAHDPLSRLSATPEGYLRALRGILPLAPRLLLLGGGGYNPYTTGRLWCALWGALNGHDMPERLPPEAEAVLRGIAWSGHRFARDKPEHWFTRLVDPPDPRPPLPETRERVRRLAARRWP